jgi:parallel beta-helix repeat protein
MVLSAGAAACGGTSAKSKQAPPPLTGTIASAVQACLDTPVNTKGTIYYVCDCQSGADSQCQPGSDGNAGTDPAKPWQTFNKGVSTFAKLNAGDTIAFCKGGVFAGTTSIGWVNPACKADNPCTVREYQPPWGSGNEALPRIVGGDIDLNNPGDATHEEGYQFLNLDFDGGSGYGIEFGILAGNDIKDVLFCDVTMTGYQNGMYVANSGPAAAGSGSDTLQARIVLRGSQILNNSNLGYLGTCDGCAVEYSLFDHNGDASILDHDIYFSGDLDGNGNHHTATGERIVGNQLYHASQGTGNVCSGNPLVVHGNHDQLLIQGNTIVQDPGTANGACWGISVGPGYSNYAEAFTNVTIAGNTVVDVGNVSIFVSSCQNCTIESNLIIQSQAGFNSTGIQAGTGSRDADDLPMNAVQVLNNTIYFDQPTVTLVGITVGQEGSGHVIASNVITAASAGQLYCLGLGLAPSAYYSNHNICWNVSGPVNAWEIGTNDSLDTWQAKTGLDAQSQVVDPAFKMAGIMSYDFSPGAGSPLLGGGDPDKSSAVDFAGNPQPSPPNVGAF